MTDPITARTDLAGLIERVKVATGPDRELDVAITAHAAGATLEVQPDGRNAYHRDGFWVSIEPVTHLTASIDAALGLVERVLPGRYIWLSNLGGNWRCEFGGASKPDAFASTAPLAILCALLIALEQGR